MKIGIIDYANLLVSISKDSSGSELDERCASVLRLMKSKGDLHLIPKLVGAVSEVYKNYVDGGDVSVTAAENPGMIAELLAKVLDRHLEDIDTVLDDSLIGGAVVRIDNTIIDASVKGKLEALALKLRK